ncbi:FliM/FliN family flagellar motor C-terminal domain-containing protein [Aliiroseovarius sediminis]|uniref:FliM/FliN family flagellar motor switch protein n=1 Tax=Aliiroseovarius sediminis TaxID=2925839 RepID=UPI001F5758BD|nr:FliM/FliN family flagellar motor C-terminal domain-containing protein [Aliiroseovarius sediminis]MCI2394009.1 FliM/FliN family flagellar motor C-terminal domain-containing protein [Aliiroseovarius sediminis]
MADPDKNSVLRQKANAQRSAPEIAPVTATGALGDALARAGMATSELMINPTGLSDDRVVLAALDGQISDHDMLALVEGPDSRFGLLVADPNLIAALIEMQTIGRVLPTPAHPRRVTRTDAAMCADFLDRVLEGWEAELTAADLPIATLMNGFRFAVRLDDYRAVTMTLPDVHYRRFDAQLDLGGDAKQGRLMMLLPLVAPRPNPTSLETARGDKPGNHTPPIVMGARAELVAVLHRARMTLDDLTGLSPGMTVIVPREALSNVALEDLTGQVRTVCRLGQAKGRRALRIGKQNGGDGLCPDGSAAPPDAFVSSTMDLGLGPADPAQLSVGDESPA